jgi:hypothetical protein
MAVVALIDSAAVGAGVSVRSSRGPDQPVGPPEGARANAEFPGSRCFETADLAVTKAVETEGEELAGDGDLRHPAAAPAL